MAKWEESARVEANFVAWSSGETIVSPKVTVNVERGKSLQWLWDNELSRHLPEGYEVKEMYNCINGSEIPIQNMSDFSINNNVGLKFKCDKKMYSYAMTILTQGVDTSLLTLNMVTACPKTCVQQ